MKKLNQILFILCIFIGGSFFQSCTKEMQSETADSPLVQNLNKAVEIDCDDNEQYLLDINNIEEMKKLMAYHHSNGLNYVLKNLLKNNEIISVELANYQEDPSTFNSQALYNKIRKLVRRYLEENLEFEVDEEVKKKIYSYRPELKNSIAGFYSTIQPELEELVVINPPASIDLDESWKYLQDFMLVSKPTMNDHAIREYHNAILIDSYHFWNCFASSQSDLKVSWRGPKFSAATGLADASAIHRRPRCFRNCQ